MGVVAAIDVTAEQQQTIQGLLQRYLPGTAAWAYGSRVKWTSRSHSDLDLVVFATPGQRRRVGHLREAFEESNLPFRVDLFVWDDVPDEFREGIQTEHVALAEASERGGPDGWIETRLGDVITLKRGYDLPERDRRPGHVPVVSSSGVIGRHADSRVAGPGVVTGRYGTLGRVFFVPDDFWPLNTALYVRDFKGNDPRFVSYFLRSLDLSHFSDTAAVPGLNRRHLHEEVVRMPTGIAEQRAIASVLGTLDDKIDLNRRMSATLEAMARALFKSWFVDFDPVRAKMEGRDPALPKDVADLFPGRMVSSELGEIPVGWEVRPLGDLLELADGIAPKADTRRQDGSVPVYGSNGRVGWHDRSLVRGPGIVVGRKGNPGTITWVATDFLPNNTTFHVVPKDDSSAWPYLFFALKVQDLPATATGSAVSGLNRNLAYMNKQVVPPGRILEHFDGYVGPAFTRSHQVGAESRSLTLLRDALLPRLLSGDLRLKDADTLLGRAL